MRATGIIIGAGIFGSAIAYELSRRGVKDLHVVDPDLEGTLSSTERNAGGVRHLWQQPVNVELSRTSIRLFETLKEEIGFQQSGYLWLFSKEKREHGEKVFAHTQKMGLQYEKLSTDDIRKKYPFLDKLDDVAFAMFGSKDGLLNSNALKNYFRSEAKKRGVTFHDRMWVTNVTPKTGHGKTHVEMHQAVSQAESDTWLREPPTRESFTSQAQVWEADFTILCAGAWTRPILLPMTNDPKVQPFRRQICLFKAEGFDMTPYGMVVDTSGVYFHAEGGNILAGLVLKNEASGFRFDYDPNFFEGHVWPALYERSSQMERLKPITGWGGLYSYSPDITGILGQIPNQPGLYEAHGFTGHGLMHSYGAAVALGELILDGRYQSIDAACLSRARFAGEDPSQLLPETLHI